MATAPVIQIGAEFRFQRPPTINRPERERKFTQIATLVTDAAGARAGRCGCNLPALEHTNANAGQGKLIRDRAALDSSANDDDVEPLAAHA